MRYRAPCAGEEVAWRRQTTPHCLPEGSGGPGTIPGLSEAHAMLIQEAPAQPCARLHPERGEPMQSPPSGLTSGLTSTAGSRGGQRHHRGRLGQQGSGQGGLSRRGWVNGKSERGTRVLTASRASAPTAGSPLPGTQRSCDTAGLGLTRCRLRWGTAVGSYQLYSPNTHTHTLNPSPHTHSHTQRPLHILTYTHTQAQPHPTTHTHTGSAPLGARAGRPRGSGSLSEGPGACV